MGWPDSETREQRLHLIWTQALHRVAVLVAMHLMYVADVSRMMNADARALSALTVLALGTVDSALPGQSRRSRWLAPGWLSLLRRDIYVPDGYGQLACALTLEIDRAEYAAIPAGETPRFSTALGTIAPANCCT